MHTFRRCSTRMQYTAPPPDIPHFAPNLIPPQNSPLGPCPRAAVFPSPQHRPQVLVRLHAGEPRITACRNTAHKKISVIFQDDFAETEVQRGGGAWFPVEMAHCHGCGMPEAACLTPTPPTRFFVGGGERPQSF